MLTEFNLINMNGRIYDPVVGRVLSLDNFVQDPFSTQNLNRYSYALNNPLRYTDPDGNFIFTALAALIPGAQVLLPFAIAADFGAFSGFLAGKAQGATGWGLVGYSLTGAVIGVISAGIGEAVLGAFPLAETGVSTSSILAYGASGAASGFFGGGFFSALSGGDFLTGALQGAAFGGITGAVAGATQHQSFVSSMRDPANLSAFVQYGSGPIPIALPWWQRVGAGLSRVGLGAGSFLASLTIIAEIPLLVTGDVSDTQHHEQDPLVFYHYTNEAGLTGIMSTQRIMPNAKGKVYLTQAAMSPADVFQNLLLSAKTHVGRGDYLVVFRLRPDQAAQLQQHPSQPFELIYSNGTLKIPQIIYGGPNTFPNK